MIPFSDEELLPAVEKSLDKIRFNKVDEKKIKIRKL